MSHKTSSIRYQWYLNRRPLLGQTSSHLSISSVVDCDVGEYVCVVSDKDLQIQSEPAVVEIVDTQSYHQRIPNYNPTPRTQLYNPPKAPLKDRGPSSCNKEQRPGVPFEPKEQLATVKGRCSMVCSMFKLLMFKLLMFKLLT